MKERPIIFSGEMVRAILAGRKTQTRRTVSVPKGAWRVSMYRSDEDDHGEVIAIDEDGDPSDLVVRCPYGESGDRLWLRETWGSADCFYQSHENDEPGVVAYAADKSAIQFRAVTPRPIPSWDLAQWNWDCVRWRSPRYMPRWASRITLEVVSVRAQRLHDISEEDARAEGVEPVDGLWRNYMPDEAPTCASARNSFASLWDSINGKDPAKRWEVNPFVWAVEFRRVER